MSFDTPFSPFDCLLAADAQETEMATQDKRINLKSARLKWHFRDFHLCLVPAFDGALSAQAWKDALWDRFYTLHRM
ncbi:MAG: hypothetical protein ABI395_07870 [Sphingobium sp.]